MTKKLLRLRLFGKVPQKDNVVHACGGYVFAGWMEIEGHD
jgi:hypothetical protein